MLTFRSQSGRYAGQDSPGTGEHDGVGTSRTPPSMSSVPTARTAVITRTFNRPRMLARAADSVCGQTAGDLVWVVVNNGGRPDDVERIVDRARGRGFIVRVLHLPDAVGIEEASNAGIDAVASDYIVIHDDDDSWHPHFLAETAAYLDAKPHYAGVATASCRISETFDGDTLRERGRERYNAWVRNIHLVDMAQANLYPPIAFLFRRSVWKAVGRFDAGLPVLGDWDFNLRVLMHGDIGFIPDVLANYHIRETITDAADPAGNFVAARMSLFQEYDPIIRNRLLRGDLKDGRIGLGWLVSLGRQHQAMWRVLRTVAAAGAARPSDSEDDQQ